jgi:hypothetical protein
MINTNFDEQLAYLDMVLQSDFEGKPREIRIREAAADIVARDETYSNLGAMIAIRLHSSHYYGDVGLPDTARSGYVSIGPVRLAPELRPNPEVAQIIVERLIRPEWP